MQDRDFSEGTRGPAEPDGPTVDEIRAQMTGRVAGSFVYEGPRGALASSVWRGEENRQGDGTATDAEVDHVRKVMGIGRDNMHEQKVARSYVERRDPVTGQVVRTYEDGRVERRA